MKPLPIEFEPNASFCYRLARYHLLNEIASEPEAMTGEPFRLLPVATRVIGRYLTDEQQAITYPARDTDGKLQQVGSALKLFVSLRAKQGCESRFVWLGKSGMYRLKSDTEVIENADEDSDDNVEDQPFEEAYDNEK